VGKALLGRTEDFMKNMSDKTRYKVLSEILKNVEEGMPLINACWASDVHPDWLEDWMKEDPRVKQAVLRQYALLERTLVRAVREGGRGMSAAKASLEILERQFKTWARKTNLTITTQLDEALEELEKLLPDEHYQTVLKVLSKHE
jgi:hypothetical protein